MSIAVGPLTSGVLLAKAPPNPNDVVGGWVAFFVVLAMGAAVVFLYFSLKKQLGKVNFEEQTDADGPEVSEGPVAPEGAPGGSHATDVAEAPEQPSDGKDRPHGS